MNGYQQIHFALHAYYVVWAELIDVVSRDTLFVFCLSRCVLTTSSMVKCFGEKLWVVPSFARSESIRKF